MYVADRCYQSLHNMEDHSLWMMSLSCNVQNARFDLAPVQLYCLVTGAVNISFRILAVTSLTAALQLSEDDEAVTIIIILKMTGIRKSCADSILLLLINQTTKQTNFCV